MAKCSGDQRWQREEIKQWAAARGVQTTNASCAEAEMTGEIEAEGSSGGATVAAAEAAAEAAAAEAEAEAAGDLIALVEAESEFGRRKARGEGAHERWQQLMADSQIPPRPSTPPSPPPSPPPLTPPRGSRRF